MSPRRIAAAHGRADRPHLWPYCGGWACTAGEDTAIAPTALLAWLLLVGGMGDE